MSKPKKKVATISLAGCFGCHMSLLDIDLRIIDALEHIEFDKSPLTDIKKFTGPVDLGIVEGGVCNDENVKVLKSFRKNCKVLACVGECALMGGLPALRNQIPLRECLNEAYLDVPTTPEKQSIIPHHDEIPKILDKVYPCHEVVKVDYSLPGCPTPADTFWKFILDILDGKEPSFDYSMIKYD
jgi:NAD-reducing hydrogenase small subunit